MKETFIPFKESTACINLFHRNNFSLQSVQPAESIYVNILYSESINNWLNVSEY